MEAPKWSLGSKTGGEWQSVFHKRTTFPAGHLHWSETPAGTVNYSGTSLVLVVVDFCSMTVLGLGGETSEDVVVVVVVDSFCRCSWHAASKGNDTTARIRAFVPLFIMKLLG
jgi:hypothetical protein